MRVSDRPTKQTDRQTEITRVSDRQTDNRQKQRQR